MHGETDKIDDLKPTNSFQSTLHMHGETAKIMIFLLYFAKKEQSPQKSISFKLNKINNNT